MAKPRKRKATSGPKRKLEGCRVLWCKNPTTGEIELVYDDKCPEGTVKMLTDEGNKKGIKVRRRVDYGPD